MTSKQAVNQEIIFTTASHKSPRNAVRAEQSRAGKMLSVCPLCIYPVLVTITVAQLQGHDRGGRLILNLTPKD